MSMRNKSSSKSAQAPSTVLPTDISRYTKGSHAKSKPRHFAFLHRIDIRYPWLKLVVVWLLGLLAILDLCDFTIPHIDDSSPKIAIAPMSRHVRITKRDHGGKMLIALTFDDGPSGVTTPTLLNILRDEDVPATFFMLGSMARNNPDLVKRVRDEGHEIASHTMYHQNLSRLSSDAVKADVSEANSVFQDILGSTPALTRPPYGSTNDTVRADINTPLILWSVDTLDWKNKNPDTILSITMSEVRDGAIILLHDIHPTSVDAVPALISNLRSAGYEFTTVSELAKIRKIDLTPGTIYYNFSP